MILASIPSPSQGVWHLGPFPVRAYALCILLGIAVAVFIADRRLTNRGVEPGVAADVATWAVPFGLIGARLYNVITDPEIYWGAHGSGTLDTLEVWHGGLGIWGGIAGGALGAYIAARRRGVSFSMFALAAAPGIPVAQAIGRFGNYFNQELFGNMVSKSFPLALHITHASDGEAPGYYQPTFLYEAVWDLLTAGVVFWASRKWRLSGGRTFAVYVMTYCIGRGWIEHLRSDYAHHIFGLRLNDWTCIICFTVALVLFIATRPKAGAAADADLTDDGNEPAGEAASSLNA